MSPRSDRIRAIGLEASAGLVLLLIGVALSGSTLADVLGYALSIIGGAALAHALGLYMGFFGGPDQDNNRRRGGHGDR